ncbi:TIGR03086 family protein [Enemella evansiae]|uniref:maleylpyruvate isomerase N-terminal domain-containing protein n=1 Tax=Enemella evansiae TaxID=2016499 RepID=UPI000B972F54|nr:maleylpyruvate isomerase N-terminal domain-containing protein [Enemella evansiae]OYO12257.1 TIGR03086 family protein [Enemella evansiae]
MTGTQTTQQGWIAVADPFTAVVDRVADWTAASPCAGWTAADVLDHVITTERDFLSGQGIELAAIDTSIEDPAARWVAHEAAVRALLADDTVAERRYTGAFGETTIGASLGSFYGFDLIVHRWDLAASQGEQEPFTDAELDRLDASIDGFGEHAYAPGVFSGPLAAAEGATRQVRVLARTGRAG